MSILPAGTLLGNSLCNAFRIDLPLSAAHRGTRPRGSWAGSQQAERDGSEQCPLRATRRQLDADARDVLGHARADLDQALSDGRELTPGQWARLGDCGSTPMRKTEN